MKTSYLVLLLSGFGFLNTPGQAAPSAAAAGSSSAGVTQATPYAVVSKGANEQVWQSIETETLSSGKTVSHVHAYTQLESGLNFWNSTLNQWVASSEKIDIAPDGNSAMATNGQTQLYFPGDIYNDVIRMIASDGTTLRSQPIGLGFDDGTRSVLIAVTTNATGAILPSGNQVIYQNAFSGINGFAADLLYVYTKSGFEQNVVIRSEPPTPESLGLNPATAKLQVFTEFFNPPTPAITTRTLPVQAGISLADQNLDFGVIKMGMGRAFLIGTNASPDNALVGKQWVQVGNRQILVEEVPVEAVAKLLGTLPLQASIRTSVHRVASRQRQLPPPHLARSGGMGQFKRMAAAILPKPGLVMDYQTINSSQTNYTFQGDTTYYLSGTVNLYGTNTFEGGAVLKYATNVQLSINSSNLNWLAMPYRPVIFTSKDDNLVGESIGTGTPTNYYANPALNFSGGGTLQLSDLKIRCAKTAVSASGTSLTLYNAQLVNCGVGISWNGGTVELGNALLANVNTNFLLSGSGAVASAQNVTFGGSAMASPPTSYPSGSSITLTNCILANVTNASGITAADHNGFYNTTTFGTAAATNAVYPFQQVGAGSYYLINGCSFQNAGTANIDPVVLLALHQKTTYAPVAYTNITVTNTTWIPTVQRDVDTPDLGYHYNPIDYAVGNVAVRGTLTLANNVAVAVFLISTNGMALGFNMSGGGDTFLSIGTPQIHNQICTYQAVQEQPIIWGTAAYNSSSLVSKCLMFMGGSMSAPEILEAHFTDFNIIPGFGISGYNNSYIVNGVGIQLLMRDCSMGPGWLACDQFDFALTNQCINNLFERTQIAFRNADGANWVLFYNNLLRKGYMELDDMTPYSIVMRDNLFDNDSFDDFTSGNLTHDHNGYLNTSVLSGSEANKVVLSSFTYAKGPLGNYYQGSTDLIDKGSITADLRGLYHFTTQADQTLEYNSTVDIGYHYVALDGSGNPIDTNGDGIPDYLEDANGNGSVDSGEIGWNITGDLGLKVLITRPSNGGIIP